VNNPRFTVGSVTGWRITPEAGRQHSRPPATIWYVYDSAYCYKPLAEFFPRGIYGQDQYDRWLIGARNPHKDTAEEFAARYAAKLNELEDPR